MKQDAEKIGEVSLVLRNGFTLVELAVSMVVIGILLGLGMSMVGPLMTSIKVRESRENLNASVESINSYASGNNRLPDVALLPTVVRAPQDAWGRNFIYLYDNNLFAAAPTRNTICGRRSTFITLTDTNTGAVIPNVAYVMLSQADDATTNSTIGGAAVTTGARAAATAITANTVDDLLRWVTLDELRTKVGCQGAQLKIVNNELPYGNAGASYPSPGTVLNFTVDGGATPGVFRWCIEAAVAAPLPGGMAFSATVPALPIQVTPANNCVGLAEANWGAAATLNLSTAPFVAPFGSIAAGAQGSYSFTLFVRDNNDAAGGNDNIASKTFVLTINPQ